MDFGEIEVDEALGCILAHTVRLDKMALKKGTVIDLEAIDRLKAGGIVSVMAARPQAGDIGEDQAAGRIAQLISGDNVRAATAFTGRANLYANNAGLFVADGDRIKALNNVDEAMTIATLPPFHRVSAGQMLATVKIIPFMVADTKLEGLEDVAAETQTADLSVSVFQPLNVDLILSRVPGDTDKIVKKRRDAIAKRVASLGGTLTNVVYCNHRTADVEARIKEVARLGGDLILIFGASAIVDRGDVIPKALTQAGGEVIHLGMPVDPGNLLLYGKLAKTNVVGVPSCAASIKENGFDWVLERLFAGLPLDREAFIAMACGGLLTEISSRPQPREKT